MALGKKFIIHDLDDTHLFICEDVSVRLQQELDTLMDKNSYSEFTQDNESKLRA